MWYGNENIVLLLLERGADVNVCAGKYTCVLHMALANKNERIARILIENGADVNPQVSHIIIKEPWLTWCTG